MAKIDKAKWDRWLKIENDDEATAQVDLETGLPFYEVAKVKTDLLAARRKAAAAANPPPPEDGLAGIINKATQAAGLGSVVVGAGAAGAIGLGAMLANRVAKLIGGQAVNYEVRLDESELAERIRFKLGSEYDIRVDGGSYKVFKFGEPKSVCAYRLSHPTETSTRVAISGTGIGGIEDAVKELAKDFIPQISGMDEISDLLSLGDEIKGMTDMASVGMYEVNLVVHEVSTYANELETVKVQKELRLATEESERKRLVAIEADLNERATWLATHCPWCGQGGVTAGVRCSGCDNTK